MSLSKAQRTKQAIIETVAPIFNKKGYQGTALSDITEATGLTKGAIYGNFQNKEKLAEACFSHNLAFIKNGLRLAWASSNSNWGKLEALLEFYKDGYETVAANGGCPLMNTAVESDDCLPYFKNKAANTLLNWHVEIKEVIENGKSTGEFRAEVNAEAFASTFIAMIEGGILLAKTTDNPTHFYYVIQNLKLLAQSQLKQNL